MILSETISQTHHLPSNRLESLVEAKILFKRSSCNSKDNKAKDLASSLWHQISLFNNMESIYPNMNVKNASITTWSTIWTLMPRTKVLANISKMSLLAQTRIQKLKNLPSSIMVLITTKLIIFMRPRTRFNTDMKFRRSLEEVLLVSFLDASTTKIKSI